MCVGVWVCGCVGVCGGGCVEHQGAFGPLVHYLELESMVIGCACACVCACVHRLEHEGAFAASIVCLEMDSMVIVCFVPDVPLQASDTFEVSKRRILEIIISMIALPCSRVLIH